MHETATRNVFFFEKKEPLLGRPQVSSRSWVLPKSTRLQKICFSNSHSPKILRPKILPPNHLTHYLSPFSLFPSKKIDSIRICQTIQKSKNYVLIIHYFSQKTHEKTVFLKRGMFLGKKKSPCQADPRCRRGAKKKKSPCQADPRCRRGIGFTKNPHFYRKLVFPTLIPRRF